MGGLQQNIRDLFERVLDTLIFSMFGLLSILSLPVSKTIKYQLAICGDYAKLTATILLNLYPNSRLFFFKIPRHVATGIGINNKIYILDQKLPIREPEAWLNYWNEDSATEYELRQKGSKYSIVRAENGKI